jgi:uncharacterized protein (DUF302 family)
MIYSKQSRRSLEELDARIREAAQRHNFGVLNVLDLKNTLREKGITLEPECRVYDVCNPQAASQALHGDLKTSTVLPCRISVYADKDGSTIATVKPTDVLASTGISGVQEVAKEVEREILAIIDEAV